MSALSGSAEPATRGGGATHWTARFQHAISELRAVLRKGIRTKLDATSSTAEALRDALGLESEGEGEGQG